MSGTYTPDVEDMYGEVYTQVFGDMLDSPFTLYCSDEGCDAQLLGDEPFMVQECFDHWKERVFRMAAETNCVPMAHYTGTCECWAH